MVVFLWVKRGRSTPYFFEYSVFNGLQGSSVKLSGHETRANLLASLAVVQPERLVLPRGQHLVSTIIKANSGYVLGFDLNCAISLALGAR